MASASDIISLLHQSRTQAQIWHHQTTSYSEHKALDFYYSGIVDKVDGLVESLQGIKPRIQGYTTNKLVDWKPDASTLYFQSLYQYLNKERANLGSESWVQNQVDEILQLVAETLYQLSLK